MPRGRMIKPDFWSDGKIAKLSNDAKLLFIAMWNFADDTGVLENSNRKILGNVFPFDEKINEKSIERWKQEIISQGFIRIVKYKEQEYLHIINFLKHQKIDKPSKTKCIETLPETLPETLSETLPDSIDAEMEVEKEVKKEVKSKPLPREWMSENLLKTFEDFKKMRKQIKKPLTDAGAELILNKLEKLSNKEPDTARAILEQSIENSWQGIFELKPINNIIPQDQIEHKINYDYSHTYDNIKQWREIRPKNWKKIIVTDLCRIYNRDIFEQVANMEHLKSVDDPEVYINSIIEVMQ